MSIFLSFLIALISASLLIYTFVLFFGSFSKPRVSKPILAISLSALVILYTVILRILPVSLYSTVLIILLPFALSLLFKFKWYARLILSTVICALNFAAESITTTLLHILFSNTPFDMSQDFFSIVGITVSKLIIILIVALLRAKIYKDNSALPLRVILPLVFLPIVSIFLSVIHVYCFIQLPENPFLSFTNSISYLVLTSSNILVFQILNVTYKSYQKDKLITASQEIIEVQSEQYQQILDYNQRIYKIEHDHKNFLIGVISELENGNTGAVLSALKEEQQSLSQSNISGASDVIAAVVAAKSEAAAECGIRIDASYGEMQPINASHIDIAVILGNAIDNATEYLQSTSIEPKVVNVFARVDSNMIIIAIKNKVEKEIDVSNLISKKNDGRVHGLGILSMQQLAKKHGGEVLLTCEDLTFETHIILHNSGN